VNDVRPFRIEVPDAELDELRARLAATRWPDELPDGGWGDGIDPATMRSLVTRWREGFDWRAQEADLNRHPQVVTEIDGARVHAIDARSTRAEADAAPTVLLLHGWPSTVAEFRRVVAPLTDPADGAGPACHVVVPSLPGFGFSGPTPERGWGTNRMARALAELMARLGHDRYVPHGGDVGYAVAAELSRVDPEHVAGVHLHLGGVGLAAMHRHEVPRDEAEARAFAQYDAYLGQEQGYAVLQSTRPQTLAYALTDTPAGQLAWVAEKFHNWADPAHPVPADDVLTTAAIYWFTRTAGSSARYYQEAYRDRGVPQPFVDAPTGVVAFPHEIVTPLRHWAEQQYRITRWVEMPEGGHFSALEVPGLVLDGIRGFLASL
jgi:pimeloyl-ACP methyl ester carboxylesterase